MKHYCDTIPVALAEKLKKKGMPMNLWEGIGKYMEQLEDTVEMRDGFYLGIFKNTILYQLPTYAEVFDWLIDKGMQILLFWNNDGRNICCDAEVWSFKIGFTKLERKDTWHEATNAAIEKALTLI